VRALPAAPSTAGPSAVSAERPRVCLFTDSLAPSGVGRHMLTLGCRLRSRFDVRIVAPRGDDSPDLVDLAAADALEGIRSRVRDGASEAAFAEWLDKERIDLLHIHAGVGWEGHHGIYAAHLLPQRPAIVRTEHLPYLLTDPGQRADHARILGLVDRVIFVSEGVARSHESAGLALEHAGVVRNGIEIATGADGARGARLGDDLLVLTVARLTEQKGIADLLAAAPAVLARVPGARFVVVGDGPLAAGLRTEAARAGLDGRFRLETGPVDLPALYRAADLFVLPSRFEGLPLALLEAMAAGVPVIATRTTGSDEVVEDGRTGTLVPVGDPAALAEAIARALTYPEGTRGWAEAARARVRERFDASRMADETARVYEQVLRARAVAA
jgi:glycosyltransferase involved in cell wall biosynthesis